MDDLTTLQMALVGYQIERKKIDDRIQAIQAQLKGKKVPPPSETASETNAAPKRVLSPAAHRRIALAQKTRWAEHRKRAAAAAKQG